MAPHPNLTPPIYSVILLGYNQQDYIADAVRALLAQDCSPINIFLSDDCSSDRTFEAMSAAAAGYDGPHRVVLNRNAQNMGIIRHLEYCCERSEGNVVIAAAGDDISMPNRVSCIIEEFERHRPLLVFSQARVVSMSGTPMPASYKNALFYTRTDPLSASKSMMLYLGATGAWHKDLFRKYGAISNTKSYEDLILGFRAALEGRVTLIDKELVIYRMGEGVSNRPFHPQSHAEYDAARLPQLERDIAVFEQRLADCKIFGLAPVDPVVRSLEKRLAQRRLRAAFINNGATAVLRNPSGDLGQKLGAILHEWYKRHTRLRKSRKVKGY